MAVRIRMKKLGRKHRPFFRICAMEQRAPRDGRILEELGTYDPMVPETDARAKLDGERINYWLSVGAQASDKVKVLIKKYGSAGTHLEQQRLARRGWRSPAGAVRPRSRSRRTPGRPRTRRSPAPRTPPPKKRRNDRAVRCDSMF